MKKVVMKLSCVAFCLAVLCVNIAREDKTSNGNVTLKGLALSADIYAESCPEGFTGKCSMSGRCFGNPGGETNCSFGYGW